jgi:hypothetical protein
MRNFEFRFIDRLGAVVHVTMWAAKDDLRALTEAQRQSGTHAIEIWQGERRVATVKKGNIPATPMDRLAG